MPHRTVSMQHFPTDHHGPFKSRVAAISMVLLLASRVLWRLDRLSLQEGDVTFPSPIPAIKVSPSGSIRELNQAARDILGAHASQLFQITGSQNMMWNAVNTLETRSGARDFFTAARYGKHRSARKLRFRNAARAHDQAERGWYHRSSKFIRKPAFGY